MEPVVIQIRDAPIIFIIFKGMLYAIIHAVVKENIVWKRLI